MKKSTPLCCVMGNVELECANLTAREGYWALNRIHRHGRLMSLFHSIQEAYREGDVAGR